MRLLILTPEYLGFGGGIKTGYQALIPALQAEGVSVRVIEGSAFHAAENKCRQILDGTSVETLEIGRMRRWHARLGQFGATPGLRRHLAAAWAMWEQAGFGEDADVIEACDWGLLFVPPALDSNVPLVVQGHGSIGQIAQHDPISGEETQNILTRLLESAILAGVDTLQTYSCANAGYWRGETGRDAQVILPAWIPPTVESVEPANRGLVVGRVQRWKGPQVVCAALELLGGQAPAIDWVGRDTVWGNREDSTSAHLKANYPQIWGKKLVHQASLPDQEKNQRQAGALFNLVPSTWDVFNITTAEAMALGRPTIVSTGAGAHELIEDGVNGYTFPSGNAEGLASAIDRVLSASPAQLAAIGQAAQATVRRKLAPPTIAAQRIAAYRSTIDAFGQPRAAVVPKSLGEACRPAEHGGDENVSFLDQLPLKTLLRYVAGRAGEKAVSAVHLSKANR